MQWSFRDKTRGKASLRGMFHQKWRIVINSFANPFGGIVPQGFACVKCIRIDLGTGWSSNFFKVPTLLFPVMIHDLTTSHKDRCNRKYVDDTCVSETIEKCGQSNMQSIIDEINEWCTELSFISFSNDMPNFQRLFIKDQCIPLVSSAKVLRTRLSFDHKWSLHIEHIISKASKSCFSSY